MELLNKEKPFRFLDIFLTLGVRRGSMIVITVLLREGREPVE